MSEAEKHLKRNLLYNTAGSLVYFACQWLVTGFFVKKLSPAGAGIMNAGLLTTAMTVTNIFLTLASYGMRNFQVSDSKYSDSEYLLSRGVTVTAAVVLCGVYAWTLGYGGVQLQCIFLYLVYKLLESVTDVFHGFCQKRERMDIIGISYGVRGLLSAGVFCAVLLAAKDLVWALAAMTAANILFCGFYDIFRTRQFYLPLEKPAFSRVWALLLECAPLALYSFFNTTAASIPKLVLEQKLGTDAMGVYGLVNSPVLILQVGLVYLIAPFVTVFTEKRRAGDKKGFLSLAGKATAVVFAVGLVGVTGAYIAGPFGLRQLYGADVSEWALLLLPMVVCTVFTCLTLFYCMLLTVLREMKGLLLGNLLGIAVSAAVSGPLVSAFGLFGASYAAIVAAAVQSAALMLFGLARLRRYPAEP